MANNKPDWGAILSATAGAFSAIVAAIVAAKEVGDVINNENQKN